LTATRCNGSSLLHDVGELVGDQALAPYSPWLVFAIRKGYMIVDRVSPRAHCSGRVSGSTIRMHHDVTEIVLESPADCLSSPPV